MCGRFTLKRLDGGAESIVAALRRVGFAAALQRRADASGDGHSVSAWQSAARSRFPALGPDSALGRGPKIGSKFINARAETVADKPTFRGALQHAAVW